jgi:hypothetical protein
MTSAKATATHLPGSLKTIRQIDEHHGLGSQQDDESTDVAKEYVKTLGKAPRDTRWKVLTEPQVHLKVIVIVSLPGSCHMLRRTGRKEILPCVEFGA